MPETRAAVRASEGPAPRARAPIPLLVKVFLIVLMLPEEASLFLGDLRMSPARAIILLAFPLAFLGFLRKMRAPRPQRCWSDWLVLPLACTIVFADCATDGLVRGIVGAGAVALDFVGAYMIMRGLLAGAAQVAAATGWLCVLVGVIGLFGLLDPISGHYAIHDTVSHLTGYPQALHQEPRYGLIRAAGTFEHPILLGTACAFALVLGTAMTGLSRAFVLLSAAIGLLASISSGPLGGALLGLGCVLYRRFTRGMTGRWRALKFGAVIVVLPIFVLDSSPFSFLFTHFTLDPSTAFYRLVIWQVGGALALASPIVGIGMTKEWVRLSWMGSSVDTVWLAVAMQFGIPSALLLAGTVIGSCSRPVDTSVGCVPEATRQLGAALGIVIFVAAFIGFTVDYWGITWMMLGAIAGLRAELGADAARLAGAVSLKQSG